jgi:lipoprotein-releasing system permease protein
MFELSVALKYLIPRRRQLSVSIIALLSVLVIALVVWLVCVFMSVTHGIERRWIETLTSLNAPVTLTPTDTYYNSYYYQIDAYSGAADFTHKTIGEKLGWADPYDAEFDPSLPQGFAEPDLVDGRLKDPVAGAYAAVEAIEGVRARDYETALANLRLRMVRPKETNPFGPQGYSQSFLNQVSYLGSFDGENERLARTLVAPRSDDLTQVLQVLSLSGGNIREESPEQDHYLTQERFRERAEAFFAGVQVQELLTRSEGWEVPAQIWPTKGEVKGAAVLRDGRVSYVNLFEEGGTIRFTEEGFTYLDETGKEVPVGPMASLLVDGRRAIPAKLDRTSLKMAGDASDLKFNVQMAVDGVTFAGSVPYRHLAIGQADVAPEWSQCVHGRCAALPFDEEGGQGILISQAYREHDVRLGDRGYLAYYSPSPSAVQEQRIPVFVAGFYDPGLTPGGGRVVLVNPEVTADVRAAISSADAKSANGIHVWFDDVYRADAIRETILANLEAQGLADYWTVETYQDYEFAKPLLEQFKSDRVLFSAIALIIIVVACSNIISMLILLVNDKRREIGVMRAMGATKWSVTAIFATCGTVMGLFGSLLGIVGALVTLRYLNSIIGMLSALQGHEAFHDAFYGGALPNELSWSVLLFVVGATIVVSVAAGVIPAIKAARIRPSAILREG